MESITTQPLKTVPRFLSIPPDKSITHRALLFHALATGTAEITNVLRAADTDATMTILKQLGVSMTWLGSKTLLIQGGQGVFQQPNESLDCGNSGTTARLLCGLLAASPISIRLIGDTSLSRRPMARVLDPLRAMGIQSRDGLHLPLIIHGNPEIQGIRYVMPVPSAQVKTALLLAGIQAKGHTVIEQPAVSRDHSERLLSAMGVSIDTDHLSLSIQGKQPLRACSMTIPGDFSSAAYWIVAASVLPKATIRLSDVGVNPTRTALIEVLRGMGAEITLTNLRQSQQEPIADITVQQAILCGITVSPAYIPNLQDEIPILCIAAAFAQGTTVIRGAHELRLKESDRLHAMFAGLMACGIHCDELPDGIIVHGGSFQPATVDSYGDHRIAMAFLIAGTCSGCPITVENTECIATSYPDFFNQLIQLGI